VVDKGACIRFKGKKYETKPSLIGFKVEIAYDPVSPEYLTVNYPGLPAFQARPVKMGSFCDKNPTLPISMQEQKAESSRFLSALEKKSDESRIKIANAISYAQFNKGGSSDV
jgi:hypothetical protein